MYLRILVSNTISVSNTVHACLAVTLLVSLVDQELLALQITCVHTWFLFAGVLLLLPLCYIKEPKCGKETAFHSRTPPVCLGFIVLQSLVFCLVICRSLYLLYSLAIGLSVIRFIASDCPFGIFYLVGFSSYTW
jgi:hypothetical protein